MIILTDTQLRNKIRQLRIKYGSQYAPLKYFRGLRTLASVTKRYRKMLRKDYEPFETDADVDRKPSSYTQRFRKKYPGVDGSSLPNIAKATGVPLRTLQTVFRRGMAAWRTGHRPGASQHAWGYARVYSFVLKGKTYHTADADLAA